MDTDGFTCGTAPGVVFPTRMEMHEHYRSDWHRYNLKRKVAGLPPVTRDLFVRLQDAAEKRAMATTGKSGGAGKQDHVKKNKRDKQAKKKQDKRAHQQQQNTRNKQQPGNNKQPHDDRQQPAPVSPPQPPQELDARPTSDAAAGDDSMDVVDAEALGFDEEALKKEFDVRQSIFDAHMSASLETNLEYMQQKYGFFIPDAEYVADLFGLFQYCVKKAKVGHLCLFCGKRFQDEVACRQHMVIKSHCKIRWEEEEDMEEYDDYYDFSESWNDAENGGKKAEITMEVNGEGEIVLNDGDATRTIGVRSFKNVYKQRYRPEEARDSVKANEKERLLLCYKRAGVETSTALSTWKMAARPLEKKEMQRKLRDQRFEHRRYLHQGQQNNLLTKNKVAGKNMGAGWGVHG